MLREANLSRANLSEANLGTADLRGANLSLSNFTGATLSDADLSGSSLSGALLRGANLCFSLTGSRFSTPRRFHVADVVNRARSSEGQSCQRDLCDGGHGVRRSITGGKDHQWRDRAPLMRALQNQMSGTCQIETGLTTEPWSVCEWIADAQLDQSPILLGFSSTLAKSAQYEPQFAAEQFHARIAPNNAMTLSRIVWLWLPKRA